MVDIFAMRNHNVDETSCFSRHIIEKLGIFTVLQVEDSIVFFNLIVVVAESSEVFINFNKNKCFYKQTWNSRRVGSEKCRTF